MGTAQLLPAALACLLALVGPAAAQWQKTGGADVARRGPKYALDPPRTNVLILLADDIGVDMIGAYGVGGDLPPTPVVDSLAQNGVLFRNAWANPICSPTRAAIQTGRYAMRNGIGWIVDDTYPGLVGLSPSEITLPEMLDLGTGGLYAHAAIGKWHLSRTSDGPFGPNLAGYDHFAGTAGNIDDFYSWPKVVDGVESTSTAYATVDWVDEALAWIGSAPEPWFCYVSFNNAHYPYHAPPANLHTVDLTGAGDPTTDSRPYYKAMVEAMDTEIGRLLAGVGSALDRTTVIFMGDNGTPPSVTVPPFLPTHSKRTVYEGGVNVPFIVASPIVIHPGAECVALVNATDIFATVADIARVDLDQVLSPGNKLDSVSFLPHLLDPSRPTIRKTMVAETFYPNGPAAGLPVVVPPYVSCQADLGFQGPGIPTLSLCGGPLTPGNSPFIQLVDAPPNALASLLASFQFNPMPVAGGIIGTLPAFEQTLLQTDASGQVLLPSIKLPGTELTMYMQVAVEDSAQPGGYAISNALEVEYLPTNWKAARNERYKLIWAVNGGPKEFYDLQSDPFELTDLLAGGPLSQPAEQAFTELQAILDQLILDP